MRLSEKKNFSSLTTSSEIHFEQKTSSEVEIIKSAAKIVSSILKIAKENIKIGRSTEELDKIIHKEIIKHNCTPAFLNYRGYPASSCISIDTELVHGIPKKNKKFSPGQIVSIDIGIVYKGFYADAATTVLLENSNNTNYSTGISLDKVWDLLTVTYDAMMFSLPHIKPGDRVGDISFSIQSYVESKGYNVIRDYVGHAIGRSLHEKPDIPNFGISGDGFRLFPTMVLCIEPMVSMGYYGTRVLDDGWTVVMIDGSLCAHYEHMVMVTENGAEILTDIEVVKPQKIYG